MTVVVDACIARSVGTSEGIASLCDGLLTAILNSTISVHMCPTMEDEWFRHMNPISRTWYLAMVQRRRMFFEPVPANQPVRQAINSLHEGHNHKTLMTKDLHLVEAAFAKDNRILSGDGRARHGYHVLSQSCPNLRTILWAHIDDNACSKAAIAWIKLDAPHNDSLLLAYRAK